MSTRTPQPWTELLGLVQRGQVNYLIRVTQGDAAMYDRIVKQCVMSGVDNADASPDLLAACQALLQYCVTVDGMPDKGKGRTESQQIALDAARAAIRKANK